MLQLPTTEPPKAARPNRKKPAGSPFDVIRKSIQPVGDVPDVEIALDRLEQKDDLRGMIVLYDAYVAAADCFMAFENQPRAEGAAGDHFETMGMEMWSRAYAVADRIKRMRSDKYDRERHGEVLFSATIAMGGTLEEAAAVVSALIAEGK